MEFSIKGLEKGSFMYFYNASNTAKNMLYYPVCAGEFYCNGEYVVERDRYDSFLVLFVLDGSITFNDDEAEITAVKNEILFIDCYKPHKYFANNGAHTVWVHFDGNNSKELYREIISQKGKKIKSGRNTAEIIFHILNHIKIKSNEYDISSEVYMLLCNILRQEYDDIQSEKMRQVNRAKEFISSAFASEITVSDIAGHVNLSVSYFSKVFKDVTTFSPYEYLLNIRLEKAKELLLKTDLPVSEVAYRTGFNSDANFIYFFKKETSFSPLKFRNMKF